MLHEEESQAGAECVYERLINLAECEDGIYELTPCNPSYDWESGYCDDYDLKLIKYVEETK